MKISFIFREPFQCFFNSYIINKVIIFISKRFEKDYHVINNPKFLKRVLLNRKLNVQEKLFAKGKVSKRKKTELVFCLFGPLINDWLV